MLRQVGWLSPFDCCDDAAAARWPGCGLVLLEPHRAYPAPVETDVLVAIVGVSGVALGGLLAVGGQAIGYTIKRKHDLADRREQYDREQEAYLRDKKEHAYAEIIHNFNVAKMHAISYRLDRERGDTVNVVKELESFQAAQLVAARLLALLVLYIKKDMSVIGQGYDLFFALDDYRVAKGEASAKEAMTKVNRLTLDFARAAKDDLGIEKASWYYEEDKARPGTPEQPRSVTGTS